MNMVTWGPGGPRTSAVCLGTANFGLTLDREQCFALLDAFMDAGGSVVDTANVYCRWVPGLDNIGEQLIGQWLRSRGAAGRMTVATKGGHYAFGAPAVSRVTLREVAADMEDSLRSLGLERIDFYWLHRDNPDMPVEEIIDFMEDFVRQGCIRRYGASNIAMERADRAAAYAARKGVAGFSALSNRWSLASSGDEAGADPSMVRMDEAYYRWHCRTGMACVPYSATAGGLFAKLASGEMPAEAYRNPRNERLYERLETLRPAYGVSAMALSIAALRAAPFPVVPVAGASSLRQLEDILDGGRVDIKERLPEEFGIE